MSEISSGSRRYEMDDTVCHQCNDKYDREWNIPKILPCGHTFCQPCIKILWGLAGYNYFSHEPYFNCPHCQRIVSKKDKLETNWKLIEKVNQVSCGECGRNEDEGDCHVCKECSFTKFSVEVENYDSIPHNFDTERLSLCSTCAIRSHIRKDHTVLDFAPIKINHRFKKDHTDIKFRQAVMNIKNYSVELVLGETLGLMNDIDAGISHGMVDILRDAKSSYAYEKIRFRIDTEIDGMTSTVLRIGKMVEELNIELRNRLSNMKKTISDAEKGTFPNMSLLFISSENKNAGPSKQSQEVDAETERKTKLIKIEKVEEIENPEQSTANQVASIPSKKSDLPDFKIVSEIH